MNGMCAKLNQISKNAVHIQKDKGLENFYTLLGMYRGFDENNPHQRQRKTLSQLWNRAWSFYTMIKNYYNASPDPAIMFMGQVECKSEDEPVEVEKDLDVEYRLYLIWIPTKLA